MIERIIAASARNLTMILFGAAFAVIAGLYAALHTPVDALPDLSDTQVIVYTEYPGQAPQVVEDQVTYPLASAMLTVPKSRVVRGFSYFGVSFVYVIFEDGTDIYWARSRVLEHLNAAARGLPGGVTPSLGPDATGVGWVYEYALLAKNKSLAELRSLQDWSIRFGLSKAEAWRRSLASAVSSSNTTLWSIHNVCAVSAFRCRKCGRRSVPATWISAAARSNCPNLNSWYAGGDT
jgi:copper/silver efflux system protein